MKKSIFFSLLAISLFPAGLNTAGGAGQDSTENVVQADTLLRLTAADSTALEQIKALLKDGQYAEAETQARELLAKVEAGHGAESLEAAKVLEVVVESLWRGGKATEPEAEQLAERAVTIKEHLLGPIHPEVAESLNDLANLYWRLGKYTEAEPLYKRALVIREESLGHDHIDVAKSLNNLAIVFWNLGKLSDAEPLYERALSIREKTLGVNHPRVASTLFNLAVLYQQQGKYVEAEPLLSRSLAIKQDVLGPDHPDVATALVGLAVLYHDQGVYSKAEPLYRRALAIYETTLGPNHPDLALNINNLAVLYSDQGKLTKAELLYEQALAVQEQSLGHSHPDVARSLMNLATVLLEQGRFTEAGQLYKRSLVIFEKAFGSEHYDVATCLENLSLFYRKQGCYADAETLARRAVSIYEKTLGPNHTKVANGLSILSGVFEAQGKYSEARRLRERCLAIREEVFGSNHPDIAVSLINLADAFSAQGDFVNAEPAYQRALVILEEAFGPHHYQVATNLNNLADLYRRQGMYDDAKPLYERALEIWETALGAEHPSVGLGLSNLALLHMSQGKHVDAQELFERALLIDRNTLDPNHPSMARDIELYSQLCRRLNDRTKALELAADAVGIRRKNYTDNAPVLSERDALTYSHHLRTSIDNYLSCYVDFMPDDLQSAMTAVDIILSSKGQVSDGIFERRGTLVKETDSVTIALAESLRFTKFLLSKLFVQGPDEDVGSYRHRTDSLAKLANVQEADLARHSTSFRTNQDHKNISSERIATLLPENAILVEYLKYNYRRLKPDSTIPRYLAVVVTHDEEPVIINLRDASEIEPLIEQYRQHLLSVSSSSREPTIIDLEDYRKISGALYKKIWKPIEEHLSGNKLVFVAPDGGLNMLSFAGLMDDEGTYLIEEFALHYLSSGRDLIRLKDRPTPATGLFALGDPDYDATVSARLDEPAVPADTSSEPVYYATTRNVRSGCGVLKELTVDPLPDTRTEVEQIARSWQESRAEPLTTYFGSEASEERFKAEAPGSRVIHLATHGYFLEGACKPKLPTSRLGSDISYVGENPLLLSGLFLAGANLHGEGSDQEDAEDGILTAYEVSGMVLDGTELVVLSACETGLGEVKEGEGVYGLRRAFQMAGARTVISALWPISDKETAEMMSQLYDKRGESLPQTIRKIQLRKINELRAQNKVDHPFSWAGFIALGDWR